MWVPLAVIVLEVFTKIGGNRVEWICTENKVVVSLNKCVQYNKYDIYDYFDLFFYLPKKKLL